MVYFNFILGLTCFITIIVAVVWGVKKTIELQADYNAKLKNIVDQINETEQYQYYLDKKTGEKVEETDNRIKDVVSRYASKSKLDEEVTTGSVDIDGIIKADQSAVHMNDIQFSPQLTKYTYRAPGNAEIANDANLQNKLVFVGNRSAGGDRKIGVLDKLDVYGNLEVDGSSVGMDIKSDGVVKVGADSAWMRSDGYVYGGNLINSKEVLGHSAIRLSNEAALINKDGELKSTGTIKSDQLASGVRVQAREKIMAGDSTMIMSGKIDGKRLCIDGTCVDKPDVIRMKNSTVPVNCTLGNWTDWGGCTRPCGGGKQYRMRSVLVPSLYDGNVCQGQKEERECNPTACPAGFVYDDRPKDCVISDWTAWGECDKRCGSGLQYRTKSVIQQPANGGAPCVDQEMVQSKGCNFEACQMIDYTPTPVYVTADYYVQFAINPMRKPTTKVVFSGLPNFSSPNVGFWLQINYSTDGITYRNREHYTPSGFTGFSSPANSFWSNLSSINGISIPYTSNLIMSINIGAANYQNNVLTSFALMTLIPLSSFNSVVISMD